MKQIWIGIDPGLHGAIAAVDERKNVVLLEDTPTIEVKRGKKHRHEYQDVLIADLLRDLEARYPNVAAVALEDVHAMPGQGVSSTFNFGMGKGIWRGVIAANRMPLVLVSPQVWKRAMIGSSSATDKGLSLQRALRLCPKAADRLTRKRDEGRAEALLLALYIRGLQAGSGRR